jgi:hypothetical protein
VTRRLNDDEEQRRHGGAGRGGGVEERWRRGGARTGGGAAATCEREGKHGAAAPGVGRWGEITRGKEGARVATSRGVDFQTTPSFSPCSRFHAGCLSGEEAGIPEGLHAPKGALGVGHDNFSGTRYYNFSDCVVVSLAHDFLVAGSAPLTSKVASFFSTPSPLLTKPVVHDYKFLPGSKN